MWVLPHRLRSYKRSRRECPSQHLFLPLRPRDQGWTPHRGRRKGLQIRVQRTSAWPKIFKRHGQARPLYSNPRRTHLYFYQIKRRPRCLQPTSPNSPLRPTNAHRVIGKEICGELWVGEASYFSRELRGSIGMLETSSQDRPVGPVFITKYGMGLLGSFL